MWFAVSVHGYAVFGGLSYFDDAEMSWLIVPNALIVEHAAVPEVAGPPEARKGRNGGAAPGTIVTALVRSRQGLSSCETRNSRVQDTCGVAGRCRCRGVQARQ